MKIRIKTQFLKIGKFEITPEIIKKEAGLELATIKCMTDILNALQKGIFDKYKITLSNPEIFTEITSNKLIGGIEFEIIEVHKIKIRRQDKIDMKKLKDGFLSKLKKELDNHFKRKNAITKTEIEVIK